MHDAHTEQTVATVFEAGVSTVYVLLAPLLGDVADVLFHSFVGLAEDPGVLAIRSPELFGVCAPTQVDSS